MISLLYTRDFQIRLLIALLNDKRFFDDTHNNIHLDDFDLPACRLIYEIARTHFQKHKEIPPFGIIRMEVERSLLASATTYETSLQPAEYDSLAGVLSLIFNGSASDISVPYFREHIVPWLLHVRVARSRERNQTADRHIADLLRINSDVARIGNTDVVLMNPMDPAPRATINQTRIGTGVYGIDRLINGGLCRTQTGLVVACTGVGKTCGMLNFAASAAMRNYFSLFVTLENPAWMVNARLKGMMAHIDARYLTEAAKMEITPDIAWRIKYAEDETYRFRNHISVIDASTKETTLSDVDRFITLWKTEIVEKRGFSEDMCLLVCIDWIEKLSTSGLRGYTKNTSTADSIKLRAEYIAEQARRHKTINWTATQGTRDAQKREVLRIEHTANSVHIHDTMDLSIGLAPVIPSDEENNDNARTPVCDRMLNASFLKSRESPVAGRVVSIYQGATLRLWDNKSQYMAASTLATQRRMDDLYSLMRKVD